MPTTFLDFGPATYKIAKLGAALSTSGPGDRFLKIRYAFLANSRFVRVFKDGVPLVFGTDWFFNVGPKIGIVADLTDGVRITGVVAGSTYRLEIDEQLQATVPPVMMWRSDGAPVTRPKMFYRKRGYGTLTAIAVVDKFTYVASYSAAADYKVHYADRLGCGLFEKGASIPAQLGAGWRLEVYHIGTRHNPGSAGSAAGDVKMDNTLVPVLTTTTNEIDLTTVQFFTAGTGDIHGGKYFIRLRNTDLGIVSQFSAQKMTLKRYRTMNNDFTAAIDEPYFKSGVI